MGVVRVPAAVGLLGVGRTRPLEQDGAGGGDVLDDGVDEAGVRVGLVGHQPAGTVGLQDRVVAVSVNQARGLDAANFLELVVEDHERATGAAGGRGRTMDGELAVACELEVLRTPVVLARVDRNAVPVEDRFVARRRRCCRTGRGSPRCCPAAERAPVRSLRAWGRSPGGRTGRRPAGGAVVDEDRDLLAGLGVGEGGRPVRVGHAVEPARPRPPRRRASCRRARGARRSARSPGRRPGRARTTR